MSDVDRHITSWDTSAADVSEEERDVALDAAWNRYLPGMYEEPDPPEPEELSDDEKAQAAEDAAIAAYLRGGRAA